MSIITILSDFGDSDQYTAEIKGKILTRLPNQQIIDISHKIKKHDIAHGAYVLKNSYSNFPDYTIHVVDINPASKETLGVAILLDNQFFIGHNNGLLSLISANQPSEITFFSTKNSTFGAYDYFTDIAIALAKGQKLSSVGNTEGVFYTLIERQPKITKQMILGQVIHIDHYGNAITNICIKHLEEIFEVIGKQDSFHIRVGTEIFSEIHQSYSDVNPGECFLLFNRNGNLEIGINQGYIQRLLGINLDAQIQLLFKS